MFIKFSTPLRANFSFPNSLGWVVFPLEYYPFIKGYNLKENWPSVSTDDSSLVRGGTSLPAPLSMLWFCLAWACLDPVSVVTWLLIHMHSSPARSKRQCFLIVINQFWSIFFPLGLRIFYVSFSVSWSVAGLCLSPSIANRSLPDGAWEIHPSMGIKLSC